MIITNDMDEYASLTCLAEYIHRECNEQPDGDCSKCKVKEMCKFLTISFKDCEIEYKEKL